jgi:hypothetical protein
MVSVKMCNDEIRTCNQFDYTDLEADAEKARLCRLYGRLISLELLRIKRLP